MRLQIGLGQQDVRRPRSHRSTAQSSTLRWPRPRARRAGRGARAACALPRGTVTKRGRAATRPRPHDRRHDRRHDDRRRDESAPDHPDPAAPPSTHSRRYARTRWSADRAAAPGLAASDRRRRCLALPRRVLRGKPERELTLARGLSARTALLQGGTQDEVGIAVGGIATDRFAQPVDGGATRLAPANRRSQD